MTYECYAYPIIEPKQTITQQDRYTYITGQKKYAITAPTTKEPVSSTSSIEDLLDQDSHALLDKVVNTAFSIVYRIRIYNDINKNLDNNWLKTKNALSQLYEWKPGTNMNIERRKSMLIKELHGIDKQKLEEKIACWKDMSQPVNYLVQFFHQNKELQQDKKLLN